MQMVHNVLRSSGSKVRARRLHRATAALGVLTSQRWDFGYPPFSVGRAPRYRSGMARDKQILKAAAKLFYERGFDGVGVDEIGAAVGITGPAIYRHFSGKDEVLAGLFDEAMDGLLMVVGGAPEDPLVELEHLIRGHAKYALENPQLTSIFAREDRSLGERFRRRFNARKQEYIRRWIDCLGRCFPERNRDELAVAVHASFGLLNSSSSWPPAVLRMPGIVDVMTSLVLDGFGSLSGTRAAARAA
jgi:AcrR family transcriptional regulator